MTLLSENIEHSRVIMGFFLNYFIIRISTLGVLVYFHYWRRYDLQINFPINLPQWRSQIKEQYKAGHSQYYWNNTLLILYRFLQWRFYLVRETQPNEVVGSQLFRRLYFSIESMTTFLLFFYLWVRYRENIGKLCFFISKRTFDLMSYSILFTNY